MSVSVLFALLPFCNLRWYRFGCRCFVMSKRVLNTKHNPTVYHQKLNKKITRINGYAIAKPWVCIFVVHTKKAHERHQSHCQWEMYALCLSFVQYEKAKIKMTAEKPNPLLAFYLILSFRSIVFNEDSSCCVRRIASHLTKVRKWSESETKNKIKFSIEIQETFTAANKKTK